MSWILVLQKDNIFSKNLLENKEMVYKKLLVNIIQTAAYNGARWMFQNNCSITFIFSRSFSMAYVFLIWQNQMLWKSCFFLLSWSIMENLLTLKSLIEEHARLDFSDSLSTLLAIFHPARLLFYLVKWRIPPCSFINLLSK